jgi:ribokinase
VQAYAQAAKAHGVTVVLNAAPAQALPAALLSLVDILIVNEGELAALTSSQAKLEDQLAQLQVPCVVVTLGGEGCLASVDGQLMRQGAFRVNVIDTTAAGDTFCGALVAALSQKADMPTALRSASAAAALACTALGAQTSIPAAAQVAQLMQQSDQ